MDVDWQYSVFISVVQVRAASAAHLSVVCNRLGKTIVLAKLLPTAVRLVSDSSEFVRAFFATEINHLSPLLGRDLTVQHILPMLLSLLRDETSEVKCSFILKLRYGVNFWLLASGSLECDFQFRRC